MHISTLYKYFIWLFLRKTSNFNVYVRDEPKNSITFISIFKGKYWFLISVVYFFSLLFFLPRPPWKQGIEFSETWEEKDLCKRQQKTERSIVLSAFLLPFLILPQWSEEEKPIICMYVYICGYIYISYSNSTSQWLSELQSHHTYLY